MIRPRRGEVWLADCGLVAKIRPVLVISVDFADADRALITVILHTASPWGSRFEISLPVPWLKAGAFNLQAMFPLAPPRFIRKLGNLSPINMANIEEGLKCWLGLT